MLTPLGRPEDWGDYRLSNQLVVAPTRSTGDLQALNSEATHLLRAHSGQSLTPKSQHISCYQGAGLAAGAPLAALSSLPGQGWDCHRHEGVCDCQGSDRVDHGLDGGDGDQGGGDVETLQPCSSGVSGACLQGTAAYAALFALQQIT